MFWWRRNCDCEWGSGVTSTEQCSCWTGYDGTKKCLVIDNNYITISSFKTKVFRKFIEEYNEIDTKKLEKINTEDKYSSSDNANLDGEKLDWDVYKLMLKYIYSVELHASGTIDDEGEVNEDKECEFEFIIKYLSTGYWKSNLLVWWV